MVNREYPFTYTDMSIETIFYPRTGMGPNMDTGLAYWILYPLTSLKYIVLGLYPYFFI
jgi:hypothetical protein